MTILAGFNYTYKSREEVDLLDIEDHSPATLSRLLDEQINNLEERKRDYKDRKEVDKREWIMAVSFLAK